MPTTLHHPARLERVFMPCQYHKLTGALCGSAYSNNSWREYSCTHPEAWEPTNNPKISELRGQLRMIEEGRHIGRTERQPEWCPLKREPAN